MVEPKNPKKSEERERYKQGADYFLDHRVEFFSGALVLIGIILSFFYIHLGGMLVGLGFGICFFEEIYAYFLQVKGYYTEQGLFKTLIWIGTLLYFLIAIPAFIISVAIGFGVMYLIRHSFKK